MIRKCLKCCHRLHFTPTSETKLSLTGNMHTPHLRPAKHVVYATAHHHYCSYELLPEHKVISLHFSRYINTFGDNYITTRNIIGYTCTSYWENITFSIQKLSTSCWIFEGIMKCWETEDNKQCLNMCLLISLVYTQCYYVYTFALFLICLY